MRSVIFFIAAFFICYAVAAQPGWKKTAKNEFADSLQLSQLRAEQVQLLPAVGYSENERVTTVPSPLMANRDVLVNMAGFHFSPVRFRLRGYDARVSTTEVNGVPMNDAADGSSSWFLWSGLTDITRNVQASLGLRAMEFSFGDIGNHVSIDTRASKQRKQTQIGYAFSNRNFTHRISATYSSGMTKRGWAYAVSGSYRYAGEGYGAGSFFDGKSYFIGVDRKLGDNDLLSINVFGSVSVSGKQGGILQNIVDLLGTERYNPYWGYQAGKKRNANTRYMHHPVGLLRYDRQIDNHRSWTMALGWVSGKRYDTGLDWYKAADPRPDYYRYLPAYQTDPILQTQVNDAIKANPLLLQINWDHLIDVNRHSYESVADANGIAGQSLPGLRSHYIQEKRVVATRRFMLNNVYHAQPADAVLFDAGVSLQVEEIHAYKTVGDLLGGEFYVDWNQFAESDFPNDKQALQNDVAHPNRILHEGDMFGYNYRMHTLTGKGWLQYRITGKKWDHFIGAELGYTNYQREGLVRNGLFAENSSGKSFLYEFTGYAVKGGSTYKINGRKYLYLFGGVFSKAPLYEQVFISPRMHDLTQENTRNEQLISVESGYLWNAPNIRVRCGGFLSAFRGGMDMTSFYHDGFQNFVNYAVSGIGRVYAGGELGLDITCSENVSVNLGGAIGSYYYSTRQLATVTSDNNAAVIDRQIIYAKNYRIPGTPQQAYGIGLNYQAKNFYGSITGSYFRKQWIEFNPLRRTYAAVKDLAEGSDTWRQVLDQLVLPDQYTIDISCGGSTRVRWVHGHMSMLLLHVGINNLLNNRRIVSGGYEQLRFDTETKDIGKFPPKLFFAMGLSYSVNLTFRL